MNNPYNNLADFCFWRRVVTNQALGYIDPVTKSRVIKPYEKVATIGSCFSQHLSRRIKASGLNYFITENAPDGLSEQESIDRNFGVFSARYGNVYTIRQALQLFDRAFGYFNPIDKTWEKNNVYVDPFRPLIEPNGFESIEELNKSMEEHLSCVKKMFIEADWLIFTLGLTEAWRSKLDGAIYPIAPSVSGGEYNPLLHEFVNFSVSDMKKDFVDLMGKIKIVNPKLQILLTVSPVSIIATYEPRNVLVSNSYSKSALRVIADEMEREYDNIIYFPSFEIVTSSATYGEYYEDNLREVTQLGVNHVMRLFTKHFMENDLQTPLTINNESINNENIVCDEETIENAINKGGFNNTNT